MRQCMLNDRPFQAVVYISRSDICAFKFPIGLHSVPYSLCPLFPPLFRYYYFRHIFATFVLMGWSMLNSISSESTHSKSLDSERKNQNVEILE